MIIIYDFDGTLTPSSVPKYRLLDQEINVMSLIQDKLATSSNIYQLFYQAYLNEFKKLNTPITNEVLCKGAKAIEYCDGVCEFLKYLNDRGVKNYLLSSGLKVYLENTIIAPYFSKIYGTTLKYNHSEVIDIDYLMTDHGKVDAIKQIVKDNRLADCQSVVYIGDGLTDMDAFTYVFENRGTSIFVYEDKSKDIHSQYITYQLKRNYLPNSELYNTISNLLKTID